MVTFRNNNNQNRRNNYRRGDRNFKSNGERPKFGSSFANNDKFKRKSPGRNNHNAPKLIEKYNDLAREALSNGDKILSENYLQHADHFQRVLNERESFKKEGYLDNKIEVGNQDNSVNKAVLDNEQIIDDNDKELDKENKKKVIAKSAV